MKPLLCFLIAQLAASSVFAGETAWQDVDEGARMRLVFSDTRNADDTTWAAIEIDLPADTKTYWRVPGESGIPLTLDLTGSEGIGGAEVIWPYPLRETDKGYLDHVHYGRLVLPVNLTLETENPILHAQATLGVCSDICVPVLASFTYALSFASADAGQSLRIRQALAETPLPWPHDDPIGEARFDAQSGRVAVALTDPGFPHDTAIADIAGEMTFLGPAEASADGTALSFPVFANGRTPDLAGKTLRLTFMTADGPYEITRPIRKQ